MNRSGFRGMITVIAGMALVCLISLPGFAQESHSSLAQKIMLENTLRERIAEGLEKVLNDQKFVVDVQAEIEFHPAQRTETVYRPQSNSGGKTETATTPNTKTADKQEPATQTRSREETRQPQGMVLPGIPSDVEFERQRQAPSATEETAEAPADTVATATGSVQQSSTEIVSHSVAQSSMVLPQIKRLNISVILEDGISPELLENARQVVKVASHFDRRRGDMLSMMTASFQKTEKPEGLDEEAVLLQNIANKVEEIERKQNEAEAREMLQQQREREKALLRRDSLRLEQLNSELEALRGQLRSQQLQTTERETTEARATELQDRRDEIQTTIQELRQNIASRDSALAAMRSGMGINPWLVGLALLILLLIIGGVVWYVVHAQRRESNRQEQRLREQLLEIQQQSKEKSKETKSEPPRNPAAEKKEIQSVRQSLVSMSVGKPDAASDILKNWLSEEETYIPGEEEPPTEETV